MQNRQVTKKSKIKSRGIRWQGSVRSDDRIECVWDASEEVAQLYMQNCAVTKKSKIKSI
jgi:hypothetical protein